jgi:hypothetical protein
VVQCKKHCTLRLLNKTRDSIAAKLKRRTFAATFLIGVIAALELERMRLEDL